MQSGKQFERLQKEAVYKLRSKFHAQTLSNEYARQAEQASLRRPEIFKMSRRLLQLRDDHRRDRISNEHCRKAAVKLLEAFPSYSVDEDPQFVCSLRILRAAAYFRGSLLQNPPASVRLALQHHTAHTFLWDAPAAIGFVTVLPSLSNTIATNNFYEGALDDNFGNAQLGSSGLVPDLTNTMRLVAPRVYQLTPQMTPSEALSVVAAYGTVDPSVSLAEQSNVTLLGTLNPTAPSGLALEDFAPSPPMDFQPPDINVDSLLTTALGAAPQVPASTTATSDVKQHSKSLIHALSTVSLMCDDHRNVSEMCRFIYYSSALCPSVGTAHLLCLQNKLMEMVNVLSIDDIVSLCRCVSRTRKASRRLMMSVGRRALLLLGEMNTLAIADVLNAFQMTNLRHLPLMKRCATRQLMLLESQTPQSAAITLACLAHFGVNDPLVFAALGRRVCRMQMDGTLYASLLHSCATAGIAVGSLVTEPLLNFAQPDRLKEEELTSNIAIAVWALAKLASLPIGEEDAALNGLVPLSALSALLGELVSRFEANPTMAKSRGATEVRVMRQTMVLEGCTLISSLLPGDSSSPELSTAKLLRPDREDAVAVCRSRVKQLMALLAQ